MTEKTPLKLLLEPGDYQSHTLLPNQGGEPVKVSGMLSLARERPPLLQLNSDIPTDMTIDPTSGEGSMQFPQISHLPTLVVDLVIGLTVVLLDCTVTKWCPTRAWVDAAAALVGPPASISDPPAITGAALQISGLDAILGEAPLRHFSFPLERRLDTPATWSATENQDAQSMTSADDEAEIGAYWHGAYSAANIYQQRVYFSPVATVELTQPLGLHDLIERWVTPLHRIVGLATGRQETITYLATKTAPDQHRGPQVFGSGITQQPYISDEADVRKVEPAFRCYGADNPTLLDLCRAWQRAEDDDHPLVKTFGAFILIPPQHPRPRYLLAIQALEGLHDYIHKTELETQLEDHRKNRAQAKAAVEACTELDADTKKFIRKNIANRPISNLGGTLKSILEKLPADDVLDQVESLDLIKEVVADPTTDATHWASALGEVRNDLSHGSRGWPTDLLRPAADLLEKYCRAHLMLVLGIETSIVSTYLGPH